MGIVRAAMWDESVCLYASFLVHFADMLNVIRFQNNILLTGGEDAKLNAWVAQQPDAVTSPGKPKRGSEVDSMDVDEDVDVSARKRRRA